jgi:hypothetical protein
MNNVTTALHEILAQGIVQSLEACASGTVEVHAMMQGDLLILGIYTDYGDENTVMFRQVGAGVWEVVQEANMVSAFPGKGATCSEADLIKYTKEEVAANQ